MNSPGSRRAVFLTEMGIGPLWYSRRAEGLGQEGSEFPAAADDADPGAAHTRPPDEAGTRAVVASPSDDAIAQMDWAELKNAVSNCSRCGLCRGGTKAVFGAGDETAEWLFVGEGTGLDDDLQGEPFVGKTGKLLDNMLRAIGLERQSNVYLTNVVKCRATDAEGRDRPPTPEEVAACKPYLDRQTALLQPKVVVALGKTAALSLLGLDQDAPVEDLRSRRHIYAGHTLIVTHHPAYLLRNPAAKKQAWADLCLAVSAHAG